MSGVSDEQRLERLNALWLELQKAIALAAKTRTDSALSQVIQTSSELRHEIVQLAARSPPLRGRRRPAPSANRANGDDWSEAGTVTPRHYGRSSSS